MQTNTRAVFVEGGLAGFLGSVAVFLFLVVWSTAEGRAPMYAAEALGSLLEGSETSGAGAASVRVFASAQLAVSVIIGIVLATLIARVERNQVLWYLAGYIVLIGIMFSVMLMGTVAVEATGAITWPAVALANAVGLVVTGGYLRSRHRRLFNEIAAGGVDAGLT